MNIKKYKIALKAGGECFFTTDNNKDCLRFDWEDVGNLISEHDELRAKLDSMEAELAELRAYKEAMESQEPDCWRITHPSFCGIVTDKKEIAEDPFYSGCVFPLYANPVPDDKPVNRQEVIDVLLSTRGQSEGVTADAILGLLSDKGAATVPDAIQLLQRVAASTTDNPAADGEGCICQSCENHYKADLLVPDDVWEQIKPEGKPVGSGLLCPSCIMDRIIEQNIWTAGRAEDSDKPAGRITEQDARDIATSYCHWKSEGFYNAWFAEKGRDLLNKLNADREQVPAVAVPDYSKIIRDLAQEFKEAWPDDNGKYAWLIGYSDEFKAAPSHSQHSANPGLRMKPHLAGDESIHFMNCNRCGTPFDMRDLNAVMAHEGDRCPSHESEQGGAQ